MSKRFRLWREESGMEFVEWGLAAALFAIAGSAGFSSLAGSIDGTLATIGERVSVSASAAPAGSGAGSGAAGTGSGRAASLATAGATPPPGLSGTGPSPGERLTPETGGTGPAAVAQNTSTLQAFSSQASLSDAAGSADGRGGARPETPTDPGLGGIVAGAISGAVGFVADAAAPEPVPTSGGAGAAVAGAIVQGFKTVGRLLAGGASPGGSTPGGSNPGGSNGRDGENLRSQAEKRLEAQRKDLTRNFEG